MLFALGPDPKSKIRVVKPGVALIFIQTANVTPFVVNVVLGVWMVDAIDPGINNDPLLNLVVVVEIDVLALDSKSDTPVPVL
jgi:hypothetical protein